MMRTHVIFLLGILLLAFPVPQHATVMAPMYMDDLTGASQTVVYGAVIAKRVEWDSAHRMIYTIYSVQPLRYLKGGLGGSFELREPGGEIGDEGMSIASVPKFQVGQEAILFVWTDPAGQHQVTAFEQGTVAVAADPASGAKVAARSIPLGTAAAGQTAHTLVDSVGSVEASALRQNSQVTFSERSLNLLMNQIRISVARTQPALPNE
ncbi:MAG: hypothetical protein EXQ56_05685 [Acidobacteria bacterium]|nr:hypothetical protein [Acidobacteriota bacterium]